MWQKILFCKKYKLVSGHLGEGLFELLGEGLDLLLVGLLPLVGLLLGNFERLEVVGNNSQLLLELHDLGLSGLGSLLGPLEVGLALLELLGDLLVLSVGFLGLVSGLLEFILELGHSLLVFLGFVLEDLLHTLGVIGGGGSLVELLVGNKELLLGLLEVLLKSLHPPVEGVDLGLGGHLGLLLLFELEGDEGQSLGGDVELSLELPGLVHQLKHLLFGLLGTQLGNLAGLLTSIASVTSVVLLDLHGLHLLFDGLHPEV